MITMDNLNKFVLCAEKTEHVDVMVWAEIKDGCLKISGQDLGQAPLEAFGEGEYEYFYDFDQKNTERFIALISKEGCCIEDTFIERFGGMDGCKKMQDYCYLHDVSYKQSTWF